MTAFTRSSVSKAAAQSRNVQVRSFAQTLVRRRWLHGPNRRQAIMMPAMSPLMTEGTITRWKKKEGEAFAVGDVLPEIESDIAMIEVEANSAGILGKILYPDGTTNVPVEQVIALVARNPEELSTLQIEAAAPTPPPFYPTPSPSSATLSPFSPRPMEQFRPALMSPRTPRTPSLFELQSMGMGHRGVLLSSRGYSTSDAACALSDSINTTTEVESGVSIAPVSPAISVTNSNSDGQLDGATIRRMIVSNLSRRSSITQRDVFHDLV